MVEDVQEEKAAKVKSYNSYMKSLVAQAELRKTTLLILPMGMTRQKENRSRYNHSKGLILWHTKWILSSISPALSFTSRVSELDNVGEILIQELMNLSVVDFPSSNLQNHLYPLTSKYKEVGLSGVVVLLEKYNSYAKQEQCSDSSFRFITSFISRRILYCTYR